MDLNIVLYFLIYHYETQFLKSSNTISFKTPNYTIKLQIVPLIEICEHIYFLKILIKLKNLLITVKGAITKIMSVLKILENYNIFYS